MNEFDADAYIEASLPLLGLTLSPESRAGVRFNLQIAERLSRLVREFPLDEQAEPAPVFRA